MTEAGILVLLHLDHRGLAQELSKDRLVTSIKGSIRCAAQPCLVGVSFCIIGLGVRKGMRRLHELTIPSQCSTAYPQCYVHNSFSYLGESEVSVWVFIWSYRCVCSRRGAGAQLGQLDHLGSPRWGLCHHVNYWQSGIHQTGVGNSSRMLQRSRNRTFELFKIKKKTQIQQHVKRSL